MINESQAAFLSYSRQDSEFAVKLAKDLKDAGAMIWFDQTDIIPGSRWDLAVERALAAASSMIVVLSPASVDSTNVMDEVSFALTEQKTVFPVLYRTCKIPFRLQRVQYLDARTDYEKAVADLLKRFDGVEAPAPKLRRPQRMRARYSAIGVMAALAAIALGLVFWHTSRVDAPVMDAKDCLADTSTFSDPGKLVEFRYPARCFHTQSVVEHNEVVRLESREQVIVSVSIYPTDRADALATAYQVDVETPGRLVDYKTGIRNNASQNAWYVVSGSDGPATFYRRVIRTKGHIAAMTISWAKTSHPSVNAPVVIAQTFHATNDGK